METDASGQQHGDGDNIAGDQVAGDKVVDPTVTEVPDAPSEVPTEHGEPAQEPAPDGGEE